MILSSYIQKLIQDKIGNELTSPQQFELLSKSIFDDTGKMLGVNTLKRLFGKIPDVQATVTTLNIIAEYLGFKDWDSLDVVAKNKNSKLGISENSLFPKDEDVDFTFKVSYEPSRELTMRVMPDKCCAVINSAGGKIKTGDVLDIAEVTIGSSLVVTRVMRDGVNLGKYIGGIEGGIESITIVKKQMNK